MPAVIQEGQPSETTAPRQKNEFLFVELLSSHRIITFVEARTQIYQNSVVYTSKIPGGCSYLVLLSSVWERAYFLVPNVYGPDSS